MPQRYKETTKPTREDKEFVRRRFTPAPWKIIAFEVVTFLVLLGIAFNIEKLGENLVPVILGTFFFLIIATILYMSRVSDAVFASEFESTLYAGSLNADLEFSLIVKQDSGQVVYISPSYLKFFRQDPQSEHVDKFLASIGLEETHRETFQHAIAQSHEAYAPLHFTDLLGLERDFLLKAEPLRRPRGYMVFKALKHDKETVADVGPSVEEIIALLQTFFSVLPWGGYIVSREGRFLYANNSFIEMLGYRPDDLIGTQSKVTLGGTLFGGEELVDNLHKGMEGEIAFKHAQGTPVKMMTKHMAFADGAIGCGLAMPKAEDDELATHSPAALTKHIWQTVVKSSPIPVVLVDAKGMVKDSNRLFLELAGKEDADRAGWQFLDVISDETKSSVEEKITAFNMATYNQGEPIDIEFKGEEKKTALLFIDVLGEVGVSGDRVLHMIDTTEQKSLELRMFHSQKMQSLGQLAGGIAHDFNNLLTAMMGFCDLLLMRHPPGDQSFADIMQIKQNANRAANLVRQLLAFSRKQTLQPRVINLTDVLAELSHLIRRLMGEKIELRLQHGQELNYVRVDQGQIEQVIINLVVNARDSMEEGGTLQIGTQNIHVDSENPLKPGLISPDQEDEQMEQGEYVLLEISDTGHGITPDIISRIFDPFFSTKEVGSGTGLGLATVYGIVKQTGGYIYVSSQLGRGTTFHLYLRSVPAEEAEEVAAGEKQDEKEKNQDLTGIGTILLVEDEVPVRIFSARALRNKGYTVLEADSGEAALNIVKEKAGDIDMIVTDVVMPGMDGPEMVEHVMKLCPNIHVIFISGYGEDAFLKSYGSERHFNFLPKPYTLKQLAGKVKEVMEGQGSS